MIYLNTVFPLISVQCGWPKRNAVLATITANIAHKSRVSLTFFWFSNQVISHLHGSFNCDTCEDE